MDVFHTLPSVSLRSVSIFTSHLRIGLPTYPFSSGIKNRILYAFLIAPCTTHFILLDIITLKRYGDEEYEDESPHYTTFYRLLL
jgi:hypothetical protein